MASLTLIGPDGRTTSYDLPDGRFRLGRARDNDIVLETPFASRWHAILVPSHSSYAIQDLGSKNGTQVNGVRVGSEPRLLHDGDVISAGNDQVTLRFSLDETTISLPMVSPSGSSIYVDVAAREVYLDGEPLSPPLSRKEFDLFSVMWERRGEACHRDDLAARGWPEREPGDVSETELEQYIHRLRRRLGDVHRNPRYIITVRGYGYRFA